MSEKQKPKRRTFDREFKQAAIDLVVKQGYTIVAAAKAVGVSANTVYSWHRQLAPKPQACGDDASLAELKAENARLRRELRQAELEREILKKATAYFAKESR